MPITSTSERNPPRIVSMAPGDGLGRIGITLCPGKTDPDGISGPWARDLDADLDAIRDWGATAVVSLVTAREIDYLKVPDLRKAVRGRHMEWWHTPIPDGEPPDPAFERRWAVAGEAIRDRLRLGFDVLVHCKGGLGRAGDRRRPPARGAGRTPGRSDSPRARGSAGSHRERGPGSPRGEVPAATARGSASERGCHQRPCARGIPRPRGGRRGGDDARVPAPRHRSRAWRTWSAAARSANQPAAGPTTPPWRWPSPTAWRRRGRSTAAT